MGERPPSHIHILDAHAIYILNLLLAFLQPKFDPSLQDDLMADELEGGEGDAPSPLPSSRDDEFRPFVRRLPEWQFWYHVPIYVPLAAPDCSPRIQVVHYARYIDIIFHDILGHLRRPSVLANPRDVLLRLVRVDYEKAATVSGPHCFSDPFFHRFTDT